MSEAITLSSTREGLLAQRSASLGRVLAEVRVRGFLPEDADEAIAYNAIEAALAKPAEVTMRQARLALLQAGLLPLVESAIALLTEPQKSAALIEWEYSNSLKRDQPLVAQLGAALGLSEASLDSLFLAASVL